MGVTKDPEFCNPVGGFTGNVEQQGPGVHRRTGISNVSTPTGEFWHIIGEDGSEAALYGTEAEAWRAYNDTCPEPEPINIPLQITPPIFAPKVDPGPKPEVYYLNPAPLVDIKDDQFAELVDPDPPEREVLIEYDADGNFERESEVVDAIFEED